MKALNLHAIGDLRYEEVETPRPGKGEVLLSIKASGICGSDLPRVFEKGTYHFPTIPGHEFAGRVTQLGEGVESAWLGKKAAVFPLLPCFTCDCCRIGEYAACQNYDYFGSRRHGGFAQYLAVPVWNLVLLPESMPFEEGALLEPAAVAVHALRQVGVDIGDRVAIFGAGPIGLFLAEFARLWGAAQVMLVDIDANKLRFAKEMGFENTVNARETDAVAELYRLTGGKGCDVCIEGAGASQTLEQALKACRPFGRITAMGNPAGDMHLSQKGYWELLRKQLTLKGTWNSGYAPLPKNDWQIACEAISKGLVAAAPLITHRFPMEQHGEAFQMMKERTAFFNKVMFIVNEEN